MAITWKTGKLKSILLARAKNLGGVVLAVPVAATDMVVALVAAAAAIAVAAPVAVETDAIKPGAHRASPDFARTPGSSTTRV